MKSPFDWDKAAGAYKPKMSELQALTKSGQLLGAVSINLSDYAKPSTYKQQLRLKPALRTVGAESYIQVEIETDDQSSSSSSKAKDGQKPRKTQMIEQLENQVDNETMKNHKQKEKNEQLRSEVVAFGKYYEDVLNYSATPGGMTAAAQSGDNGHKYRMIPGITDFEVK